MRVFIDPNALTTEKISRTWKERLFTWPWKPFKKFNEIKKPGCYRVGDNMIVHPEVWEEIKKEVEAQKWNFNFRMPIGLAFPANPFIGIDFS